MEEILTYIIWYFILPMIYVLSGAFWIYNAVCRFKVKHYFMFGFDVFMAIHSAFCLFELVLEEPF